MGIETTKALQARRRESAAKIERLIARTQERDRSGSARRARIKEMARLGRRKVRALTDAKQSVQGMELEIGQVLVRILGHGVSRNEAFELIGLSRHVGRGYLDLAMSPPAAVPTAVSTEPSNDCAAGRPEADLDLNGNRPPAPGPGRQL